MSECKYCGKKLTLTSEYDTCTSCQERVQNEYRYSCRFPIIPDGAKFNWNESTYQFKTYPNSKKSKMKYIKVVFNEPQKLSMEQHINYIIGCINSKQPKSQDLIELENAYKLVIADMKLHGVLKTIKKEKI